MAKQITQETFDDVVKENIEDFEMTVEEAIRDAEKQFESQGVNLNMIIRDPSLYSPDGKKNVHPVIEALSALSLCTDEETACSGDTSDTPVCQHLDTVRKECDTDLSRRCFVGKNKAYNVLLKCSKRFRKDDPAKFIQTLETMCSLCNGQPDLLDEEGASFFMEVMEDEQIDEKTTEIIVKLVRLNCEKHEINRRLFVKKDLVKNLVRVLVANKKSPAIVKEVCYGLRVMTQDDDVRVEFGSAHENAKKIVIEGDALKQLLEICSEYTDSVDVQGELFSTLGKLMVRDEFCKEVKDLGGLDLILKSFQVHIKQKSIVRQALGLLKALAGNDEIKVTIVKSEGIELILGAMTQHQGNAQIAAAGCLTLAALVLRQPSHCDVVIGNNGHHVIVQAMKVHPKDAYVQKQACMAIRNIVARTRQHSAAFLQLGAEDLINLARTIPSCEDEAKAALRDLDCEVELKVRWTGQKGGLAQDVY